MSAISIFPSTSGGYVLSALSAKFQITPDHHVQERCSTLIDCCSLNLCCQHVANGHYFSAKDICNLTAAYQQINKQNLSGSTAMVLDISSGHKSGYLHPSISDNEQLVFEYLQDPTSKENKRCVRTTSMRDATDLFEQEGSLSLVVFEGSLKHDLLLYGGFSKEEQEELQNNTLLFCQIAEVFINAMKFGQTITSVNGHTFANTTYFKRIDNAAFKPCIHSYTLYPPLYANVYHLEGRIPSEWKKIFSVTGQYDPNTEITTLYLKERI